MSMDRFAPLSLVGLASVGALKGAPAVASLPVDATLLAFGVVAGTLVWVVVFRHGLTVPRNSAKAVLMLATFVPPLLWASWSNYGTEKVLLLFTVTTVCLVGPMVLVTSLEHVRILLVGIAVVGLVMAASTLAGVELGDERVGAFGGSALHVGLWASIAAVACGLWSLTLVRRAIFGAVLAAGAVWAIAASGTRSGLAGAAAGLVVALVAARGRSWHRALQVAVVLPVMAMALVIAVDHVPEHARNRIISIVEDERLDASTTSRLGVWSRTSLEQPLGAGIGDWQQTVDSHLTYPHNVLLEVGAEAGWLPLVALIAYLGAAVQEAWRRSDLLEGRILLGGLVVLLINAMTHGDINSQRLLFVVASASLMLPTFAAASAAPTGFAQTHERVLRHP